MALASLCAQGRIRLILTTNFDRLIERALDARGITAQVIADANDMKSWVYNEDSGRDDEYIFSTDVVVSAREEADVGKLASSDKWTETEPTDGERVWTDDYSNLVQILK